MALPEPVQEATTGHRRKHNKVWKMDPCTSSIGQWTYGSLKWSCKRFFKGLLFVHQSKDQRRLLERYGNEICMLDATYKTTRYSLPLFFVVVKTNIDYQIVGSCIVQSEATDAIFEGLSVLKSWNQIWNVPLLFYGWLFRRRNVSNWIVIPR